MVEMIVSKQNNFLVGTVLKGFIKKYIDGDRMEVCFSNGILFYGFITEKIENLTTLEDLLTCKN